MYDFDTLLARKGTDCYKWDAMAESFGKADLMPFWVADMDFPLCPEIHQALENRIGAEQTYGYTIPGDEYFNSVIAWNEKRHGLKLRREEILNIPGVVTALAVTLMAVTKEGDGVLINPPVYPPFFKVVKDLNRTLVCSPLVNHQGHFEFDFEDLERKLSSGVKAYILCSPHNPVGRVWTREELEKIAALCKQYQVRLISDEIHYDIVYPGYTHTPVLSVDPDAVLATAPSKTFNIAGLKGSTIFVKDVHIRRQISTVIGNLHLQPNLFSYTAAEAAYSHGAAWVDELNRYLAENARFTKAYLEEHLPKAKVYVPESTYLMWIDFSDYGLDEKELHRRMIQEAQVALNKGSDYGADYGSFARLNIAVPRWYLEQGLKRLSDIV